MRVLKRSYHCVTVPTFTNMSEQGVICCCVTAKLRKRGGEIIRNESVIWREFYSGVTTIVVGITTI